MTIPISSLRFPTRWVIGIFIGLTVALLGLAAEEPAPRLPAEAVCLGNLYAGTFDNHLAIRLSLVRQGEQLDGAIYYEKDEQYDAAANRYKSLRLEGKVDNNGRFILTESDPGKEAEARVTGRFAGAFDAQGQAKGTWENPTGERKLSFHFNPTDSLEQGQKPRFRLRCERGTNGNDEQAQLLIGGEKPVHLMGVDGELLGSKEVIFDPTSVSVRLLEGQPNLYEIVYKHSRTWEPGVATIQHRRHWVVRAGNTAQTLFNQWTQPIYQFSRAEVGWDRSDNIVLSYQGSTLQVVETRSTQMEWQEPSISIAVSCSEECGCPMQASEEWECHNKDCYSACLKRLLARDHSEDFLDKTVRMIDVGTGQTTSQQTFWMKDYYPLRYQFAKEEGETPLSFLVLDDGIAGWLIVRKSAPETPKPTSFDPENPGQIPAIATCWLYNRVPWDNANATRPYPPAPPDQMRPDHFALEHCCVVETSADGKRTSLYENLKAGQDEEEAGRLLTIFDGSSQNCFSANLLKDGRWGKALVESIAPHERITLGSGVRLRTGPYSSAREIARRVPIGTVVLVLGRSAFTTRIDGVEDRWYYVAEPKGVYGWAFGGLLAPFDSSHPEKAYRQIVERYLASKTHGPAEEADFQAFLGGLRAELPKPVAETEEGKDDPRRLLTRFDEHMQACRTPHRAQDGRKNPIQVESVAPHKRITLGSGVRLRPDPESGCGQINRLSLGTVVSVLKRSIATARIGGVEDRWYQIQTPDGATGWVFGGLLLPFNQAHPEQAYREIVERHLASEAGMLRDEVEFLEFLAHVRPNLPEALVSDFELARLEGIDRAVAPFSLGLSPLSAPWMAEHLAELEPHVREGYLWIHDAYWAWLERNHHHPAAERLAWRATQNPSVISIEGLVDEAEGEGLGEDVECDSECDISYLTAGQFNEWVRYLRLYPDGAHAVAAVEGMVEILNWVPCETRTDSGVITCTCGIAGENFRKGLQAALEVLLPVKGAQAAAARERINALLGACSPVGATAQPAPASGISTAQPFAL